MPLKNKEPDPKIQKGKKNEFEIMAKLWSTACLYIICRSRIQTELVRVLLIMREVVVPPLMEVGMGEPPKRCMHKWKQYKNNNYQWITGQEEKEGLWGLWGIFDHLGQVYRNHRGVWYQEEVGRGRDGGETEGAGAEAWRKDADNDDGFYAKNGGMPSYFLAAPQSFSITTFFYAILSLHTMPWFSTF